MAHDVHPGLVPATSRQVAGRPCRSRSGGADFWTWEAPQHYPTALYVFISCIYMCICIWYVLIHLLYVYVCYLIIYIYTLSWYIYMYPHIIGMYVIYIYIHTWFGGSYSPENGGSADSVKNDSHPWKSLVSSAKMWRKPVVPRYFAFWLINHIRSRYLWVGISRNDVWIFGCDFFSIPPAVLSTTLN